MWLQEASGGGVDRVPPVRGSDSRQLRALAWGLTPFSQEREHEEHEEEPHLQAEAEVEGVGSPAGRGAAGPASPQVSPQPRPGAPERTNQVAPRR